MIRAIAIAAAGLLATYVIRKVMAGAEAGRVKARAQAPQDARAVTKLRQDPMTGVYSPEE